MISSLLRTIRPTRTTRLFILVGLFFLLPLLSVYAQPAQFTPLVGIPGVEGAGNLNQYMNAIYRLSITLAALLAVIMIIYGGVQYMFHDVVTDKIQGKKTIKGAILGFLLILSAVLILSTVNRDLTNFDILISPIVLPDPPPPPPRIRDLAGCEADTGCVILVVTTEAECTQQGGRYIPGGVLSWAGGGNFQNRCLVTNPRITACTSGLWDNDNSVCLENDGTRYVDEYTCVIGMLAGSSNTYECRYAERDCRNDGGVVSRRVSDRTINCIKQIALQGSVADRERCIADGKIWLDTTSECIENTGNRREVFYPCEIITGILSNSSNCDGAELLCRRDRGTVERLPIGAQIKCLIPSV